jgi:hypothetical protein
MYAAQDDSKHIGSLSRVNVRGIFTCKLQHYFFGDFIKEKHKSHRINKTNHRPGNYSN